MKSLVLHYSHTGNSQFLADKIATALHADQEAIVPRVKSVPLLVLNSTLGWGAGNKPLASDLGKYDLIVVCGPVWMGQLIAPLREAIKACCKQGARIALAVSCGSGDEDKDQKYGYAEVFRQAQAIGEGCVFHCEAFPTKLAFEAEEEVNDERLMNARLSEVNFQIALADRLTAFLGALHLTPVV